MAEVKVDIVVPSMGRAGSVTTGDAVSNAILCVPESEEKNYREHHPELEIETHPDSIKGITLKRQWILEHHPNVFMVDDDMKSFHRLYVEQGEPHKLEPEEAWHIIQYVANCAKMAGAYLFGISKTAKPTYYNEFNPIGVSGMVEGCIGILKGSRLFFHERATVSEDYWICGYNAYQHRKAWIDQRFCYTSKSFSESSGGLAGIRNMEEERENALWLRQMFGEALTVINEERDTTKMHYRNLKIPF